MLYSRTTSLPVSAEEAYAWHARPGALDRLLPPWQRVDVLQRGGIEEGERVVFRLHWGPWSRRWVAEHGPTETGRSFVDVAVSGPFRQWRHTHEFLPLETGGCRLQDRVELRPPGGRPTELLFGSPLRAALERTFAFRHRTTREDLEMHDRYRDLPRQRVAVTGASGLVGRALVALLRTGGHQVTRLVRHDEPPASDEARWDPDRGIVDLDRLEGLDAVVHLAGENLAAGRWTEARRRRIWSSRVDGTAALVDSLGRLERPPSTLLNASAIGYYGLEAGDGVDEDSPPGSGFLADLCVAWEEAAAAAEPICERVATLRFGIVLSPSGGALAKMLPIFRLGAGGVVGDGRQAVSWISLDDAVGAIHHLLMTSDVQGPVNLTSPSPTTNRGLTRALGRVLRRPTLAPVPSAMVKLLFGQMGKETLLSSCRALPRRLEASGYRFRHPELEDGLRHLLGRSEKGAPAA